MPHLRLALAAGGLLLAVPALSSCGFDYPTERVNTVGAGVSERSEQVDVTGAAIVSGAPDSGNLIGSLSNNSETEGDTLVSVSGSQVEARRFEPVDVAPGRFVNLAALVEEGEGIEVTGDFVAGDFVEVTFEFEASEPVTLNVPVAKNCYEYEGLAPTDATEVPETDAYECTPPEAPEPPAEH